MTLVDLIIYMPSVVVIKLEIYFCILGNLICTRYKTYAIYICIPTSTFCTFYTYAVRIIRYKPGLHNCKRAVKTENGTDTFLLNIYCTDHYNSSSLSRRIQGLFMLIKKKLTLKMFFFLSENVSLPK